MISPFLAHAIDRLFARLTAVYGREFTGKFDGTTPEAVKIAWAHELRGFERQFDSLAWALDHLPERCPNAIAFRNLCRQSPPPNAVALSNDAPVRGPTPAERAAVKSLADTFRNPSRRANHDWAYRLIERHENGDPRPAECVAMARRSLGVRPPDIDETPLSEAEAAIAQHDWDMGGTWQ